MKNINKVGILFIILMSAFSFSNLLGVNAAGISVCLGVIFFFINKAMEKQPFEGSGLDTKAIGTGLKEKNIWFWIALPLIMDGVSMGLAKLVLPGYIDHVLERAGAFVSFENLALSVVQMIVLALGEEIAWRAFYQKQLLKAMPIAPVLVISSFLFAIGHIASGSPIIVAYDVFFVFVNSILYGIIFHKTQNAWISWISHFVANLFSVLVLVFL
jgi:membrane protease YdiL (CAAX protease family)